MKESWDSQVMVYSCPIVNRASRSLNEFDGEMNWSAETSDISTKRSMQKDRRSTLMVSMRTESRMGSHDSSVEVKRVF
jgi:hypothetical protein